MWEVTRKNRGITQPMIETLEDRQLMSVVAHPAAHAVKAPAPHAIVMPANHAAKATKPTTVSTLPVYIPAAHPNMAPDIVGNWSGTMLVDGSKQTAPFSINFLFQHGVAASGTFNLGPTVGNQSVTSTMVFGVNHNTRALVLTPSIWMGFTGALSANGNVLAGRFSVNLKGSWQTGSFTLNRN